MYNLELLIQLWGFPGGGELLIILLLLLIVFGARKLPEIGRSLGVGLRNFKKGLTEGDEPEKKSMNDVNENDKVKVIQHEEKK